MRILCFLFVSHFFSFLHLYLLKRNNIPESNPNQLTIKQSDTCFICFHIMSDWEVNDHLRLSLNKFGYLIPGSNCL